MQFASASWAELKLLIGLVGTPSARITRNEICITFQRFLMMQRRKIHREMADRAILLEAFSSDSKMRSRALY